MIVLVILLLLVAPTAAAADAAIGSGGKAATLEGLREWEANRATAARLLGELKADPARGKAVEGLEREWKALDRKMQTVRALQTRGQLDTKTALVQADDLGASIKKLEAVQEEIRNKRQMETTAFQKFEQKASQLMNMLTAVLKTIGEMRGIGAGSRSGL